MARKYLRTLAVRTTLSAARSDQFSKSEKKIPACKLRGTDHVQEQISIQRIVLEILGHLGQAVKRQSNYFGVQNLLACSKHSVLFNLTIYLDEKKAQIGEFSKLEDKVS